ncbi:hypothetical protein AGDE_14890 [Angomonas deanei]|nr:hypothetical protein AGDE_14890 [Angomonas deanei]|eukprot:EPY20044.1 hypothetical protein AGDE_14890 [Angomonas deanei]
MDPKIARYLAQYRVQDLWDDFMADFITANTSDSKSGPAENYEEKYKDGKAVASDLHAFLKTRLEKEQLLRSKVKYVIVLSTESRMPEQKVAQQLCEKGIVNFCFSPALPPVKPDDGVNLSNISALEADIVERGIERTRESCVMQFRKFVERCYSPEEEKTVALLSAGWPKSIGDILSLEREVGEPVAVIVLDSGDSDSGLTHSVNIVLAGREAGLSDPIKERVCLLEYCDCKGYTVNFNTGGDEEPLISQLKDKFEEVRKLEEN